MSLAALAPLVWATAGIVAVILLNRHFRRQRVVGRKARAQVIRLRHRPSNAAA